MQEPIGHLQEGGTPAGSGGPSTRPTAKVAVVGAGSVGATLAYAVLIRGAAREVVLYDVDRAKVRAQALDLAHGIQFMPMARVEGSDDVAACAGADIVAVTAGAKQQPGQTRIDLAARTVGLARTLMPRLVKVAPHAVYLMVTNPVDVVTYAALRYSGLPRTQVFGSGAVLDSSRSGTSSRTTSASPCRTCTPTSPASTATPPSRCGRPRRSAECRSWTSSRSTGGSR
ncbi:lactate/malate family dehydrogenase [Cellulosimicrobium protaetiae]|uniref:lactate/malate family dehydrogenase n=1 Tax=Cellulosimicrobium protaetiae TaxID=2587808 RepID=UPI00300C9836